MNIAVKLLLLITKILAFYFPVLKYTLQLIHRLGAVLSLLGVVAAKHRNTALLVKRPNPKRRIGGRRPWFSYNIHIRAHGKIHPVEFQ